MQGGTIVGLGVLAAAAVGLVLFLRPREAHAGAVRPSMPAPDGGPASAPRSDDVAALAAAVQGRAQRFIDTHPPGDTRPISPAVYRLAATRDAYLTLSDQERFHAAWQLGLSPHEQRTLWGQQYT